MQYLESLKIGFCTYETIWKKWGRKSEVASTRIRVNFPYKYMKNAIISDDFDELSKCDAVIFQTRYEKEAIALAKELKEEGKIVLLDFTDPLWDENICMEKVNNIKKMCQYADMMMLPTGGLSLMFTNFYNNLAIAIVPDRIDLDLYTTLVPHRDKQKYRIVWHGAYGNISSIDDLAREDLERLGKDFDITLVCIYNETNKYKVKPFENIKVEMIEWSNQGVIDQLLNSDLSINPKYVFPNPRFYKSNNKTVTAWALGVPCIENNFYEEGKKFLLSADLRNIEGREKRKLVEDKFDAKLSAIELEDIVHKLALQKEYYKQAKITKQSKNNILVYTAICDDYDKLKNNQVTDYADFIAYMDNPQATEIWKIITYERKFFDPTRDAKIFKVLSHLYASEYEYSLWIDGSIELRVPVKDLINRYLIEPKADIAVYKHTYRDCIYEEAKYDIIKRKDNRCVIEPQIARYRADGHPEHWGLYACTIIFRRNCKAVEEFNNAWWAEICAGSERDQEAFSYLLRKLNMKFFAADTTLRKHWNTDEFNNFHEHNKGYRLYGQPQTETQTSISMPKQINIPKEKTSAKKIAILILDDLISGLPTILSTNIKNIANGIENAHINSSDNFLKSCDILIFQDRFEGHDIEFIKANKYKKFILDLSEPWWEDNYIYINEARKRNCVAMMTQVDTVIVHNNVTKRIIRNKFSKINVTVANTVPEYIAVINSLTNNSI